MVATLLFAMVPFLKAQQSTAAQRLTLRIGEVNVISLTQPVVQFILDQTQQVNNDTVSVTNSEGMLLWTSNGENQKITIATNRIAPRYILKVNAINLATNSGLTANEAVLRDNSTHDLIMGVTRSSGKCSLGITASASLAAGIGIEAQTLTYTITGD